MTRVVPQQPDDDEAVTRKCEQWTLEGAKKSMELKEGFTGLAIYYWPDEFKHRRAVYAKYQYVQDELKRLEDELKVGAPPRLKKIVSTQRTSVWTSMTYLRTDLHETERSGSKTRRLVNALDFVMAFLAPCIFTGLAGLSPEPVTVASNATGAGSSAGSCHVAGLTVTAAGDASERKELLMMGLYVTLGVVVMRTMCAALT